MDGRRAGAALVAALVPALAGCGGGGVEHCLLRAPGAVSIERTIGDQRYLRFADGSLVGIVRTRSADEAARIASGAGGPGDPYAYEAVGRFLVAWRGAPADPHLRAVERCLR
jgi:hypothetical protein